MKKITGYIGAMIIVFALMGSVLLGYALNINGSAATINEYENVTDVSGLYSYSDQKTYTDYNPASNYIGYKINDYQNQFDYDLTKTYKKITNATITIRISDNHVLIDGVDQGTPGLPNIAFICNRFYIFFESYDNSTQYYSVNNTITATQNITITVNGNTITTNINGKNWVYYDANNCLSYCTINPDYYGNRGNDDFIVYLQNPNDIIIQTNSPLGVYYNGNWLGVRDQIGNYSAFDWLTNGYNISGNVYSYDYNDISNGINAWARFYPISAIESGTGINYSESNRVNNYPMVVNPSDTSTQTTQLTLTNISAASVWPVTQYNVNLTDLIIYKKVVAKETAPDRIFSPEWATPDYNNEIQNVNRNYRLSDILSTLTIPSNVKTITIDANGSDYFNVQFGPYAQYGYAGYTARIDKNLAGFTNIDEYQTNETLYYNDIFGEKDYIVYNTETGVASIYDYTGVKKSSNSPDKIAVGFVLNIGNNYTQATGYWYYNDQLYSYGAWNDLSGRSNPYLNITYTIVNPGSITYMDITRGVSIDATNNSEVIWDNQYENGNIQLLFRSENTNNTYHNDLTISGNDISIDYTDSRYYVTLNSGDPVDIGTWRNIILNVDLVNGKLSAIPVRTFNSFTNVQMDSTSIFIGDLIDASPTNIITWGTTTNSLMFNVYQTAVFMDTYGVVMVNPTLDITTYFTDLNNFYRMKIYNFSIYGESMTINGITGTVTDNTLTINDETLAIKEMYVTYADNHAYIEDSHVSVDLGEITTTTISMTGSWYFNTILQKGYTASKMIYEWDWSNFILDNTQFCIFYIGLALAALVIARRFCNLSMIDYAVFIASIIIALSIQVIA